MVDDIAMNMSNIDLIIVILEVNLVGFNPNEWWIDTNATHYVCFDKKMSPLLATSEIKGKGKVVLKMTSIKELNLTNVLFFLENFKNLVTSSLLNNHGFQIVFESKNLFCLRMECMLGKDI